MFELKVAVVTGAAGDIGLESAKLLRGRGHHVVLVDKNDFSLTLGNKKIIFDVVLIGIQISSKLCWLALRVCSKGGVRSVGFRFERSKL